MRQLLAVALLGGILAFTASAALADDHGGGKGFRPTQPEVMSPNTESAPTVITGPTMPGPSVDLTNDSRDKR